VSSLRPGLAPVVTLAAVGASIAALLLGSRILGSGPNWLQSLAARPYLIFAERGISLADDPYFWLFPAASLAGGLVWAYAMTRTSGPARLPPVFLGALAFAFTVNFETQQAWWLASYFPIENGLERTHLGLGIAEAAFVVAAVSSGALAAGLGLGWRSIPTALFAGLAAAAGAGVVYVLLDASGLHVGTGDLAMVKLTLGSAGGGAVAGGVALGRSLQHLQGRVP
jgi:hypothetical protein